MKIGEGKFTVVKIMLLSEIYDSHIWSIYFLRIENHFFLYLPVESMYDHRCNDLNETGS